MRGFFSFLLDCLVPRSCLVCGRGIGTFDPAAGAADPPVPGRMEEFVDAGVRMRLRWGLSLSADVLCGSCWSRLEPARGAGRVAAPGPDGAILPVVSPFHTNNELLALVKFLKFSGGRAAAPALGWWMAAALGECSGTPTGPDPFRPLLVPVPLHPKRERERGYNQSALLAREAAARLGLEVEERMLARIRNTKAQSTLESEARAANVEGAFRLARPDLVGSRNIVLVDDLVTTGETALACAAALREGSPCSVTVLAAGRVRG